MGDGTPVSLKNVRNKVLTGYSRQPVSCDGYFSSLLYKQFNKMKQTHDSMVIIGHPKAQSVFSIQKLDAFIGSVKGKCDFTRYSDIQQ